MKPKKKEIFEKIAENPAAGVKLIYESYGRNLYSYGIKSWKLSEDDCWEIVYKTIYKAAEKTKTYQFNTEQNYRSFIFTIFINLIKNHFKKREKSQLMMVDESGKFPAVPQERDSSAEAPTEQDSAAITLLKEELDRLDDWERILLLMRCQDIPYSDISKYVNKPAKQLKVYYQRLKNSMLQKLEQKHVFKKENSDERK